MSRVTAIISTPVICTIVRLSWAVNHYHDNAIACKEQCDKKASKLRQATTVITGMQQRRYDTDVLDARYMEELADAKIGNNALQRKFGNGGRVLVKGRCSISTTTRTTGVASMGDDTTVELSAVVRRNALGIRSGILGD